MDTCVIIDYLEKVDNQHKAVVSQILNQDLRGDTVVCLSAVSRAEITQIKKKVSADGPVLMPDKQFANLVDSFFTDSSHEFYSLTLNIAAKAASLRRKFTNDREVLTTPDAAIVATAVAARCTHIITRDAGGQKDKESSKRSVSMLSLDSKLGGNPKLRVMQPREYWDALPDSHKHEMMGEPHE